MKKLSKKQKLIGFIAILLVAVIIAIVITTSIIKNNSQVASEVCFSTTANANSNLVASSIKEGITIGGITGTLESLNTFDATALPEDILWGETAYVKGEKITGTKVVTVAQAQESQKVFEENTILIDDYGNSVKVPEGFKIASDSATAVTGGVVIEDVSAEGATEYTKGSQFVWVPVGDVISDSNGNITEIILGRYTFNTTTGKETLVQSSEEYARQTVLTFTGAEYQFQELLKTTNSLNKKAKDLEDFVKKTNESKGFFIGRFELGDALSVEAARTGTATVSNPANPVACKKEIYPYNFINQADASKLCQQMYYSNNFESDLINSYAIDTAIVFIQSFSIENYSTNHRLQGRLTKCGEATDGNHNDIVCNIYDIAGNVAEWSTETGTISTRVCIGRGGWYINDIVCGGNRGGNNLNSALENYGARPILYL